LASTRPLHILSSYEYFLDSLYECLEGILTAEICSAGRMYGLRW
jgi:hypothetical protein